MNEARPPYPVAACIALGALVLYVATLAPTTQFWDASEYITAAHALGIPHPPGSPLFVILAHAWGLLPLGADYARRINLFAVGTSADLFMPIRAHFDPYLNEGEPTSWSALHAVLTREQFGKPSIFDNPMYPPGPDNPGHTLVLYGQQLLNYAQYFTWQWGRDWFAGVQRALAVVFGALGLLGARRHWRAERRSALALTTLAVTLTLALVFYLNFKWGYSQPFSGPGLEHEVRERDYFYLAAFAAWGVWFAMGLAALMERIPEGAA